MPLLSGVGEGGECEGTDVGWIVAIFFVAGVGPRFSPELSAFGLSAGGDSEVWFLCGLFRDVGRRCGDLWCCVVVVGTERIGE